MLETHKQRVVVIGSGIAGLTCTLDLIERGFHVVMVTKAETPHSATWYAQGGIASARFDDDSISSHIADTMIAGAGLCDEQAVDVLVSSSAQAVDQLIERGAHFDTLADGEFARAREGGHNNSRIIHAGGDATGKEIERALVAAADLEDAALHMIDYHMASKLLVENGRCVGVEIVDVEGKIQQLLADHVVLSTGGAGQLFSVTTNPLLATADGVALALNAGVLCADLEFMQFHPTALHIDNMPRPLLSEALRGEGAVLRDENGIAFMDGVHPLKDLAPRDVVSRTIAHVLREHKTDHVFLDATSIKDFPNEFPTIWKSCSAAGIDPITEFLPVSPAAHYFCGGVMADINGATSMPGLWAAGEVSCNGVHGANRLASNSLLDGLVFGGRVADAISSGQTTCTHTGVFLSYENWSAKTKDILAREPSDIPTKIDPVRIADGAVRGHLQKTMTENAGVVRSKETLEGANIVLDTLVEVVRKPGSASMTAFAQLELSNLIRVAGVVVELALSREESRGCHTRDDFPHTRDSFVGRQVTSGNGAPSVFIALNA